MAQPTHNHLWWQYGVLYQIYPRSFQDSNGDGVGDLPGILSRLDYLKDLGITGIWISPIFPSPMADFGYDISDYTGIHPLFGNMADFDELVKVIHTRGMKLILDLVPNHTSDQHPWFLESRSSRDNPKRDWYIWKDPKEDGSEPNNWLACFGGTGWEWDEHSQQYYYHAFLKEQPDLNWRNPEVQQAMMEVLRFWLDKGVDGFRVDVMWHMIKDEQFRDNPPDPGYQSFMPTYNQVIPVYSTDQPEVHEIVAMMREVLDEYEDRLMIGEIYLPISKLVAYYGLDRKEAHLPFNFQLLTMEWNPLHIARMIAEYEGELPADGWPNWVLGNHDQSRVASRLGSEQARVAAVLLLTLRGTPTIYYGEEIGMRDVAIPYEEIQDPQGKNMPDKNLSRDPARTPMAWGAGAHGGFSASTPWLRVDSNYQRINVARQEGDPYSMLSLYKKLVKLREQELSLSVGEYVPIYSDHQLIVFLREKEGHDRFLVLLNLSHRMSYWRQGKKIYQGRIEVATDPDLEGTTISSVVTVGGDVGMVVRIV